MYIDESGDTATSQAGGSDFLVLAGCIVNESDKIQIEKEFRAIKEKYYYNPEVEIKSNFLRYANPDIIDKYSPIKLQHKQKYDELEADIAGFLKRINVNIISVVMHKTKYWEKYPAQNPYHAAYIFLLERFQTYLQFKDAYGLTIIDPREGKVEKQFIGAELDNIQRMLRWQPDGFWKQCPNIIERALFSTSDLNIGIQITDLYCYPIFHVFEYNKTISEYWRFRDVVFPKLYYHTQTENQKSGEWIPQIDSTSIKVFPEETKKGLRIYGN